jgi:hypothetical protein
MPVYRVTLLRVQPKPSITATAAAQQKSISEGRR